MNTTRDLFDPHPLPRAAFDGPEYVPEFDAERLTGQLRRVFNLMRDGEWRSLDEIADKTGDPHASVSAQLRHLRKNKFGNHTVDKRRVGEKKSGYYKYRLIIGGSQ